MKLVVVDVNELKEGAAEAALAGFPAERRAEIVRLQSERARARSIVAEATVRLEIVQTLRLLHGDIAILRGRGGKPYLGGVPSFQFNISHSGGLCVCAFDSLPVGVDVEKIRPINYNAVAERCFTAREIAELDGSERPEEEFFRIWTGKESIAKQRGTGLAGELKRLDTAALTRDGLPLPCRTAAYGLSHGKNALLPPASGAEYALSLCTDFSAKGDPVVEFCSAKEVLQRWLTACR